VRGRQWGKGPLGTLAPGLFYMRASAGPPHSRLIRFGGEHNLHVGPVVSMPLRGEQPSAILVSRPASREKSDVERITPDAEKVKPRQVRKPSPSRCRR
jgi:hypothetical protein